MSAESTENDAEIARILSEEYESVETNSNAPKRGKSCSPVPSKRSKIDHVEQEPSFQFDEDSEMAYILQIEEIVLSENQINDKTTNATDAQLEKTHAAMTKQLQPTEQTDFMTRILGMFATIQTRYTTCQAKNQTLIDQIQNLSIQLYPMVVSFKNQGRSNLTKAAVPMLAIGLITNVLQGNIGTNDAKQIMMSMLQIWTESNVWYEFLEQLVYILVAVTVPSFAQGAIGKLMGKISPTN